MTNVEIATLPALKQQSQVGYPLSTHTGEPRRPVILMVAIAAFWLSAGTTIGAFALWWWVAAHVPTFHSSARLLTWTQPYPVSAWAIILVILIGLIALLMVTAAGVAAYNSWSGQSWIRVGALVCLGVMGLSGLLTWWFTAAAAPMLVGAALLWTPPVGTFLNAMKDFRTVKPVAVPTTGIKYGPQPLIGSRETP